jgi:hypothetical protein
MNCTFEKTKNLGKFLKQLEGDLIIMLYLSLPPVAQVNLVKESLWKQWSFLSSGVKKYSPVPLLTVLNLSSHKVIAKNFHLVCGTGYKNYINNFPIPELKHVANVSTADNITLILICSS